MNQNDFKLVGGMCGQLAFSDGELDIAIAVHKCLIAYFEAKGEPLITKALRGDLTIYTAYQDARVPVRAYSFPLAAGCAGAAG